MKATLYLFVLACFLRSTCLFGQNIGIPNAPSTGEQPLSELVMAQYRSLEQSLNSGMAGEVTSDQMKAWQSQQTAFWQKLQPLAVAMSAQSTLQPIPSIKEIAIPGDASPTLTDFLETQANLANDQAQIHNQWISTVSASAAGTPAGQARISQLEQAELRQFQQEDATQFQAQQQRAQTLADEAAQQLLLVPPPLVIPPGASLNLAALLTLSDQLQRAQVALWNRNLGGTAATQGAALLQWQQQNIASLQQMQQLAQAVASEPTLTATIATGPVMATPLSPASPIEISTSPTSETKREQ